jgi:hypothetical protein
MRVEGVELAKFSYERGQGWVTFDTTKTSPEQFLEELDRMTDYSGTVREFVSSESVPADEDLEAGPGDPSMPGMDGPAMDMSGEGMERP